MGKEGHWCIALTMSAYQLGLFPGSSGLGRNPPLYLSLQLYSDEQRWQHIPQRRTYFVTAAIMSVEQRQYEGHFFHQNAKKHYK